VVEQAVKALIGVGARLCKEDGVAGVELTLVRVNKKAQPEIRLKTARITKEVSHQNKR
jgi:hypothetical protein